MSRAGSGARKLVRGSGTPLWQQIAAVLAQRIGDAHYAQGRLPAEQALAEEFGVNRHTVRQALQGLKERGVLESRQGRGSAVRDGVFEYALGLRTRFSQNLAAQQSSGRLAVLGGATLPAGREIARALDLRTGTRVERVDTLGTADDLPLSQGSHWFAARRFAGIGAEIARTGSITRALAAFGVDDYLRAQTRITAELPDAERARLLHIGPGQPVLLLRSLNVDAAGVPVQFSETAFAADRVQLVIDHAGARRAV